MDDELVGAGSLRGEKYLTCPAWEQHETRRSYVIRYGIAGRRLGWRSWESPIRSNEILCVRASERASDIESGGNDGREEGEWDGEKQPKRRLFFSFHIADERNSDV